MITHIPKSEQYNNSIFEGGLRANKPVFNGQPNVKPYSNLFYWSNGYALQPVAFDLHPHQGFEIMTFLLDGNISHYDTATKVWTPLHAGDFQIIQSNRGIRHQERVEAGSRAFQIWFDPNFEKALTLTPSYTDYLAQDFLPQKHQNYQSITYVGQGSKAQVLTPDLTIKKLIFDTKSEVLLPLNPDMSYTFYVIDGHGTVAQNTLAPDDVLRIQAESSLSIEFEGSLFYIETPTKPHYTPVWE